jgi:tetratricopeptide (TPR) repeat protein
MLRGIWVTVLAMGAVTLAQQPGQQPQPNGTPGNGSNNQTPRLRNNPNSLDAPGSPATPRTGTGGLETIYGRVVLSDGAEPDERVKVQQVCGLAVSGETYTDAKGRFAIPRAASANTPSADSAVAGDTSTGGCELRASLSGYQPGVLPLTNRRANESNDVGVIVLHRAGPAKGLTITATTLLAPKDARKSYDKGLEAIRHSRPDQAQKDFTNAVHLYPRFAAAWFELGKVYEQRDHLSQARSAYGKSIAADRDYLFPYERLYRLAVRESKWQEAADTSSKVLRLNPYEFSSAYYFNAVANLELRNLDAAEHSAREAVKLEGSQAEPRGNYVLGVILWRRGDLAGAGDRMRTFLAASTSGPEQASAQRMLDDIDKQLERRKAREKANP